MKQKSIRMIRFFLLSFTAFVTSDLYSEEVAKSVQEASQLLERVDVDDDKIILAQKKSRSSKRSRPKNLIKEKTLKFKKGSKNKTNLDFDAADISGQTKNPYGTGVRGTTNNKGYDFIWIRKKWHPEMFQSASSLDAGY